MKTVPDAAATLAVPTDEVLLDVFGGDSDEAVSEACRRAGITVRRA